MGIYRWLVALFFVNLLGISPGRSSAQTLCGAGVCVLTWQDDTYRTGQNLNESTLTYDAINENTFGQLCSVQLDGQVYAQPLVVTDVTIGGVEYDRVAYVVTENDTLYAI